MATGGDGMLELRCKKTEQSKIVDVYTWPEDTDADFQSKMSDIVHTIIQHQRPDLFERIIKKGWDPNKLLSKPKYGDGRDMECRCRNDDTSALRQCVWNLWTEGVKVCLDAGADPNFNPEHWTRHLNPLELAVHRDKPEMVKFLLEKGANPNIISRDDRSLTVETAVINCIEHQYDTRITQLLFEHGSGINAKNSMHHLISGLEVNIERICRKTEDIEDTDEQQRVLNEQITKVNKGSAALLELIVKYGHDVTKWNPDDSDDLVYMLINLQFYNSDMQFRGVFYQQHLDLIYRYGGYTDEADVLEDVDTGTHTNTVRWLIRHGADTTGLKPSMLVEYLYPELGDDIRFEKINEIPFVLVQSGIRVPEDVRSFLLELDKLIEKPHTLDEDTANDMHDEVCLRIKSYLDHHKHEESSSTKIVPTLDQRLHQMADLEEFSDESLYVYPQTECYVDLNGDPRDMLQNTASIVVKVLDFVSQPLSLQWWCRHHLRTSLQSLHPSVVKTLPGPTSVKRFILCHEL